MKEKEGRGGGEEGDGMEGKGGEGGREGEGEGRGGEKGEDVEGPGMWSAPGPVLALGGPDHGKTQSCKLTRARCLNRRNPRSR